MAPDPLTEEAARWRAQLEDGTADGDALEAWLRADPRRRSRFEAVGTVWSFFDEVRDHPEMLRRRRGRTACIWAAQHGRALLGAATAACLVIVGLAAAVVSAPAQARLYETGAGGREVVRLADGSKVTLDVKTRLEVRYSLTRRALTLYSGQAKFEVVHNSLRPFSVSALGRTVVDKGTAFDVDLQGQTLTIALIRGRVNVFGAGDSGSVPAKVVELDPGQALVAGPGGETVAPFDSDSTLAWVKGRLVFDDLPLQEAVERENRYASRPIILTSSRIGQLRVSGIFNAGDTRGFAEAVAALLPVSTRFEPDGAVAIGARWARRRAAARAG
ncbi:MAG: FecR domain-containing protein [Caulobacteraceae bacterium]|nr:FecR domain-containing protein [Caulobacteraceae bacterium]MBV9811781.1 FecR domain-containing protein [Acetobacteraceae bacterium]